MWDIPRKDLQFGWWWWGRGRDVYVCIVICSIMTRGDSVLWKMCA